MKKQQSFFQKPQVRVFLVIFVAAACYLFLANRSGQPLDLSVGFFIVGLMLITLGWLVFFAQFVLPLHRTSDRFRAFQRLLRYMLGVGGQATFIENGMERKRRDEWKRKGAGVMVLDTASGAVLSNGVSFTRVVGPGLVFTAANEHLAGAVDLHRQHQPIPPLGPEGTEDPFAVQKENEADDAFKASQARRLETSALTRDGVEVVPNLSVIFRLERLPGDEDLSFGYNPKSVEAWVRAEGRVNRKTPAAEDKQAAVPGANKSTQVPLNKLPAYLGVDVFREYLQKVTLAELFLPPVTQDEGVETGIETILGMVQRRLTSFQYEEMDSFGQPTGRVLHSLEFEILQDCGIRVEAVIVSRLRLKAEIERKLVDDWIATWLERARAERSRIEARRVVQMETGSRLAVRHMSQVATRRLSRDTLQQPRPADEAELVEQMKTVLDTFLRSTLQDCILEPSLRQRLSGEINTLSEMINWVRMQQP